MGTPAHLTSHRWKLADPGPRRAGRSATTRRAEMLDQLCALFLDEGFAHFTLEALAARLHCSKSTLYTVAGSKEQLAVRVVGYYFQAVLERIEREVAGAGDVRSRLRALLTGVAAAMLPASRRFIQDVAANLATRGTYDAYGRAVTDRMQELITEGMRQGVFRSVHPTLVAEMVNRTLIGIQRGEIAERTGLSDAEAFAELSRFLLGGLAAVSVPEEQ
jgi:AcrR family transcriptional regulator